jgi:hypothetical protein
MSGEVGLASAISAYLLAHFGGFLPSSPTPASAPVAPTATEFTASVRTQPPPPAAAAVDKRLPAPQQDTDAPAAQPTPKVGSLPSHMADGPNGVEFGCRAPTKIVFLVLFKHDFVRYVPTEREHRHCRLLRARGKRPCRRTSQQHDELAPPHSITSLARC